MTQPPPERPLIPAKYYGEDHPRKPKNPLIRYASYAANIDAMQCTIDALGITTYRLGKLLGMATPGNAYQWFDGRKRPSAVNCIRIIKLMTLVYRDRVILPFIESINWDTGEIVYKNGVAKSLKQYRRAIQPNQSENDYSVPTFNDFEETGE